MSQVNIFTIGRNVANDLVLKDATCSNYHAIIFNVNDSWHIINLNSTNGCFVNYKKVLLFQKIKPNQVIRFGKEEYSFKQIIQLFHQLKGIDGSYKPLNIKDNMLYSAILKQKKWIYSVIILLTFFLFYFFAVPKGHHLNEDFSSNQVVELVYNTERANYVVEKRVSCSIYFFAYDDVYYYLTNEGNDSWTFWRVEWELESKNNNAFKYNLPHGILSGGAKKEVVKVVYKKTHFNLEWYFDYNEATNIYGSKRIVQFKY